MLSNFGPSQTQNIVEKGLFRDHMWLKVGSKANQKVHSCNARVGLEVVIRGLHKYVRLFCMAQCGNLAVGCLFCPFWLINDLLFGFRLSYRNPSNYQRCWSLSKSFISTTFGVLFHFTAIQL